jgi:hypothetical protein
MTIAEFYRHEARCQDRSAQSSNIEQAEKWFVLADEYLRLAQQFETDAQLRNAN